MRRLKVLTPAFVFALLLSLTTTAAPVLHDPQPPAGADKKELQYQLGRYLDQEGLGPEDHQGGFLNLQRPRFFVPRWSRSASGIDEAAMNVPQAEGAGAEKKLQESDVYKTTAEGLLYYLNGTRGLQIIDYKASGGAGSFDLSKAKLLGSVAATGMHPDTMFTYEAANRLIVVERAPNENPRDYMTLNSRILFYDVADPRKPSLQKQVIGDSAESRKEVVGYPIQGRVTDSRFDEAHGILYIITTMNVPWRRGGEDTTATKGFVYSFDVKGNAVMPIEDYELSLPTAYRQSMQIVKKEIAPRQFKYYLIAYLQDERPVGTSWWFDRRSQVEVVDISDEGGSIEPIMKVKVKGQVGGRNWASVKDDTLIVVSNYREGDNGRGLRKIAIETFAFPTDEDLDDAIEMEEAEDRQGDIETEIRRVAASSEDAGNPFTWVERDKLYVAKTGAYGTELKGVFVKRIIEREQDERFSPFIPAPRSDEGRTLLEKWVADNLLLVDTSKIGPNAIVNDVRYMNDELLYVFWAPVNNIDPFDLFDISNVGATEDEFVDGQLPIQPLDRLQFSAGVIIQKGIPVKYQGRDFVIGLGTKTTTNEGAWGRNTVPHAIVAEVTRVHQPSPRPIPEPIVGLPVEPIEEPEFFADGLSIRPLSTQLRLHAEMDFGGSDRLWANFRGEDKTISMRSVAEGQYRILFSASATDQVPGANGTRWAYYQGGKLLDVDLTQVLAGNAAASLREGSFLKSARGYGYIRKAFNFPEVNAFVNISDNGVVTFDASSVGTATGFLAPEGSLELSRDVQSYVTVWGKGIQILRTVEDTGRQYREGTELRMVENFADAEKADAKAIVELDGTYEADLISRAAGTLVVTEEYTQNRKVRYRVYKLGVISPATEASLEARPVTFAYDSVPGTPRRPDTEFWELDAWEKDPFFRGVGNELNLVELDDAVFISKGRNLAIYKNGKFVQLTEGSCVQKIEAAMGGEQKERTGRLVPQHKPMLLGGKLYVHSIKKEKDDDFGIDKNAVFERHYVTLVDTTGGQIDCGKPVNIPGEPIALIDDYKLVTKDLRFDQWTEDSSAGNYTVQKTLALLELQWKTIGGLVLSKNPRNDDRVFVAGRVFKFGHNVSLGGTKEESAARLASAINALPNVTAEVSGATINIDMVGGTRGVRITPGDSPIVWQDPILSPSRAVYKGDWDFGDDFDLDSVQVLGDRIAWVTSEEKETRTQWGFPIVRPFMLESATSFRPFRTEKVWETRLFVKSISDSYVFEDYADPQVIDSDATMLGETSLVTSVADSQSGYYLVFRNAQRAQFFRWSNTWNGRNKLAPLKLARVLRYDEVAGQTIKSNDETSLHSVPGWHRYYGYHRLEANSSFVPIGTGVVRTQGLMFNPATTSFVLPSGRYGVVELQVVR